MLENYWANAGSPETGEPGRVSFFTEAALAHKTACTLRDLGDLKAAEAEFKRSVRTRRAQSHARTHSVTLSYLGAVQVQQGHLEAACSTWSQALDAMSGVQSGRAREAVIQNNPAWEPSGTFAHRNHRRQNRLAISQPRLLRIVGHDLYVTDLDAVDGTPVFDFAGWFPPMGPRGSVRAPKWVSEMLVNYWENADERPRQG